MIIATIRVVQLGSASNESSSGRPAPSWLAMWGIIEASIGMFLHDELSSRWLTILIAVMIDCCPGLYRVVKSVISPSKARINITYTTHVNLVLVACRRIDRVV